MNEQNKLDPNKLLLLVTQFFIKCCLRHSNKKTLYIHTQPINYIFFFLILSQLFNSQLVYFIRPATNKILESKKKGGGGGTTNFPMQSSVFIISTLMLQ